MAERIFSEAFLTASESLPEALATDRCMVFTNVFTDDVLSKILLEFDKMKSELRPSQIGKQANKTTDPATRGDKMLWLETRDSGFQPFFQVIDHITTSVRQHLFLPIRRFEAQLAFYSKDQFYARHRDRHAHSSSRLISLVFYLNDWQAEDGGELVIYQDDGKKQIVPPQLNSMVVFSSELEHEVLPTHKPRKSLTAWLRDDIE